MKRLLPAVVLALLLLPAQAGAKGYVSLSVCGTNGCHTTRDKQELADAQDSAPQADPGRAGAFFKLRAAIGEPGYHGPVARVASEWIPSVGVVRGDEGPMSGWTLPTPATKRVLARLSHGLQPFPASQMPRPAGDPQAARIAESVGYPRLDGGSGGGHGGSGGSGGWAWALLAIPVAAVAAWLVRRRRGGASLA